MKLMILLPGEVFMEAEVAKVIAEARNGSFCLLPRHVDFVAALVPGLFSFETAEGRDVFLAIDEGILVKCGGDVLCRHATRAGSRSRSIEGTVEQQFKKIDSREKKARMAMAKDRGRFCPAVSGTERSGVTGPRSRESKDVQKNPQKASAEELIRKVGQKESRKLKARREKGRMSGSAWVCSGWSAGPSPFPRWRDRVGGVGGYPVARSLFLDVDAAGHRRGARMPECLVLDKTGEQT
jgi:F-type H+-transporting ATPase subunit epsilon